MYPDAEIAKQFPSYVKTLAARLAAADKRAYPVGGCVRDLLRGVTPNDFDMTTNATPEEIMAILFDLRVVPTGIAHGTVTVIVEEHAVELTTHRTDGTYHDSRHPDSVTFTDDLTEDLARRDFTVNAMAFDLEANTVIDPFGGKWDLENGIIRAVGDPTARFLEDALRILRAFRFAAKLDFEIEEKTKRAAKELASGLSGISVERIFTELQGTLVAPAAKRGMLAIFDAGALPFVFFDTVPDPLMLAHLATLPTDAPLRLAALLHAHTPEVTGALCRRWHTSNAFREALCAYLNALGTPLPTTHFEARRFVCHHFPHFENALLLHGVIHETDVTSSLSLVREVFRDKTAVEIRRLAVNGRELQERVGVRAPATAAMLQKLQEHVWQYPNENKKSVLLDVAKELVRKEPSLYA